MVTVGIWRAAVLFPMYVMVTSHRRHSDTEPSCPTSGGPCRGISEAECNDSNGWKLRGSDWGCCGNYDGCCTYASLICYFHDAFCRCCDAGDSFCGPTCRPEVDCFPRNSNAAKTHSVDADLDSITVSPMQESEMTTSPSYVDSGREGQDAENYSQSEELLYTEETNITGSGDMSVTVII